MAQKSRNQVRVKKHLKIRTKIHGTATKPRLCVFKSLKHFEAQLIDDQKRITLVQVSTLKAKMKSGGNVAAARALGTMIGQKIQALKIKELVFDRAGYIYHGRVKAFAEAVRAEGIKF